MSRRQAISYSEHHRRARAREWLQTLAFVLSLLMLGAIGVMLRALTEQP